MGSDNVKLTICILAGQAPELLEACLAGLKQQNLPWPHEVMISFHPDIKDAIERLVTEQQSLVVLPPTRGPAGAVRQAFSKANGEMVALINPAVRLTDPSKLAAQVGWLDRQIQSVACVHRMQHQVADTQSRLPYILTVDSLLSRRDQINLGTFVVRRAAIPVLPGWFDGAEDPGWALAYLLATTGAVWHMPDATLNMILPADSAASERVEIEAIANALLRSREISASLAAQITDLRINLSEVRARPLRSIHNLIIFKILDILSRSRHFVPPRMAARFSKSAAKRNPQQSLRVGAEELSFAPVPIQAGCINYAGAAFDQDLPTILVVTHEATRTGAPILALNLCNAFSARCNVVVLVLRNGELVDHFREHAAEVHIADRYSRNSKVYDKIIARIARKHTLSFAIVNSLESVGVISSLGKAAVPIVSLVHEFPAYTNPKSVFADVLRGSDDTVFSTHLTLDDAAVLPGVPSAARLHVVPQGKSRIPPTAGADSSMREAERLRLQNGIRPSGATAPPFVVLGAGSVHLRKGLDIFISCAARVLKEAGGRPFRFVWIGHGYEPEADMEYSAYLADQIKRSDLGDSLVILRQTSEIELAYQLADAFLLSSRLDPLPNVAIDAMAAGLPVLCFDRTTGISEHLLEAGLGEALVASYLDTAEMAGLISALAASPEALQRASNQCRALAATKFEMPAYINAIERIALAAVERRARAQQKLQ